MKTWTKTKVQGLMRHKSGRYYACVYVGDKEKWVSLKIDVFEIAKVKMRSDEKVASLRERQSRGQSLIQGDWTVEEAAKLTWPTRSTVGFGCRPFPDSYGSWAARPPTF